MVGASAALTISGIPFKGPIGAVRVGRVDGEFIVNPTHKQLTDGDLNLLLGGRKEAMNMMGLPAGKLRLPLVPLRPENRETLRKALIQAGRLKG